MAHLIEATDGRPMNVPALYQGSDRILQRALIRALPVSPHGIVDHVEIQTDRRSIANEFIIRYKFADNHPLNVKGTFIDICI